MKALFLFVIVPFLHAGDWSKILEHSKDTPPHYPIPAYSEFSNSVIQGVRPYEPKLLTEKELNDYPYLQEVMGKEGNYLISKTEETELIQPALKDLAAHLMKDLLQWREGEIPGEGKLKGLSSHLIKDNPYLPANFKFPKNQPIVSILPLLMSRIPKDLNRYQPWAIYGTATEDWETLFWRELVGEPKPFFCQLMKEVFQKNGPCDLKAWDFRILVAKQRMRDFEIDPKDPKATYLFTFLPISAWPKKLREDYSKGKLVAIPHPLSLAFSGSPFFQKLGLSGVPLSQELSQFSKHVEGLSPYGLQILGVQKKNFRFANRARRQSQQIDFLDSVFTTDPDLLGLYNKPLAKNLQMWGVGGELEGEFLLDGPTATSEELDALYKRLKKVKPLAVHYRNYYPMMNTNSYETSWVRPWVSWIDDSEKVGMLEQPLGAIHLKRKGEEHSFPVKLANYSLQPKVETKEVKLGNSLSYSLTVNNAFEKQYWDHLVELTEGGMNHKNNADCSDSHCKQPDLLRVRDLLKGYYQKLKLPVYSHKVPWKPLFDYDWWKGLKENHENLVVVIHGKDGKPHSEAIIMADHYDTAYMADIFEGRNDKLGVDKKELTGHRYASKGADDNHSATATLMMAAQALKDLPLKKDVWLVHLTGEEYPADCLGARVLAQDLVEGKKLFKEQGATKVVGGYILDMVGHNTGRDKKANAPSIFQITPGRGPRSEKLAQEAWAATQLWNQKLTAEKWNQIWNRKQPWKRIQYASNPKITLGQFVPFTGEIRPPWHPRSTLFNTDAQIWSDAGIPVVLFMEDYDINRQGYHDTLDDLDNIDLDYARGVASIAIESVARAASE